MEYIFDASQVDPSQGFEIWPDNTWVKVIATGFKPVGIRDKEGQGRLVWNLKAVEGPLAGKTQFLGMNLWIDNANGAQDIAKRELSALVWVTLGASQGRLNMGNFNDLCNIPFYILSKHGYNNNSKQTTQDWNGFKDINGVDAGKQGAQQAPAAAPGGFPGAAPAAAPGFAGAPAAPGGFGAPAGAPAPGGFPGQPQQAPGGFPGAAPAGAPAAAPGFAPGGPAPFGGAPAGAPGGFPPATAPAPGFSPGAPAPGGFPAGTPAQPGFGAAPGGFAPPAGQAPAGTPPWGAR